MTSVRRFKPDVPISGIRLSMKGSVMSGAVPSGATAHRRMQTPAAHGATERRRAALAVSTAPTDCHAILGRTGVRTAAAPTGRLRTLGSLGEANASWLTGRGTQTANRPKPALLHPESLRPAGELPPAPLPVIEETPTMDSSDFRRHLGPDFRSSLISALIRPPAKCRRISQGPRRCFPSVPRLITPPSPVRSPYPFDAPNECWLHPSTRTGHSARPPRLHSRCGPDVCRKPFGFRLAADTLLRANEPEMVLLARRL